MLCPECKERFLIVECDGVELDVCHAGHGIWFDAEELRQLFERIEAPERLLDLEDRLTAMGGGRGGARRRCPRCRARMDAVQAPGRAAAVILDRCRKGHGLWFDRGELNEVLAAELSDDDTALRALKGYLGAFAEPRDAESEESNDG